MNSKLSLAIKTSRPLFWLLMPLIFLVLFYYSGAQWTTLAIIQAILLTFPYCLFVFGLNDIYDYETDKINARKGGIEGVILKKENHKFIKTIAYWMGLIILLSSLLTQNITNIAAVILLLSFSYMYSVPPIRLKEKPILDSIANGIIILTTGVLGWSYGKTFLEIPLKGWLLSFAIMAIHSLSTLMDYTADKKAGQTTIGIILGKRFTALFSAMIFAIVLIFADFNTKIINLYLQLAILLSMVIFISPGEKTAGITGRILFIAAILSILLIILQLAF